MNRFLTKQSQSIEIEEVNGLREELDSLETGGGGGLNYTQGSTNVENGLIFRDGTSETDVKNVAGIRLDTNNTLVVNDVETANHFSIDSTLTNISYDEVNQITSIEGELDLDKIKNTAHTAEIEFEDTGAFTIRSADDINISNTAGDVIIRSSLGTVLINDVNDNSNTEINGKRLLIRSTGIDVNDDVVITGDKNIYLTATSSNGILHLEANKDVRLISTVEIENSAPKVSFNNTTNTNNIAIDSANKSISFNEGGTTKSTISNSGNYLRIEGDGVALTPSSGNVDIEPSSGNVNLISNNDMFIRTITIGNVNITSNNDMFIRSFKNVNLEATSEDINISSLAGTINIGGSLGTNIVSNNGNVNLNSTTGQVLCEQTPTTSTSVVNKQYVDSKSIEGNGFEPVPFAVCNSTIPTQTSQFYYQTTATNSFNLSKMAVFTAGNSTDNIYCAVYRGLLYGNANTCIAKGTINTWIGNNPIVCNTDMTIQAGQSSLITKGESLIIGIYLTTTSVKMLAFNGGVSSATVSGYSTSNLATEMPDVIPALSTTSYGNYKVGCHLY